jgi:hypothetical protein
MEYSQMRFSTLALTLALSAFPACAEDDFGVLQITNANVELGEKSTLQIHTRLRSYQDSRQFYQFRAGPIYMHVIPPRVLGWRAITT